MRCNFCKHEADLDVFIKANQCPACGNGLDNFYTEEDDEPYAESDDELEQEFTSQSTN